MAHHVMDAKVKLRFFVIITYMTEKKTPLNRKPADTKKGFHIPLVDASHFDRDGFSGDVFVPKEANLGFVALQVDVHGKHPRKRILEGNIRSYYVVSGEGIFTLGEEARQAQQGDLFVIPAGSEYAYEGVMTLFEFNVSPDNSFGDEQLE